MPSIQPPQFAAPHTWRDFLIRVATIAVAALIVLGATDLFESLHNSTARRPVPYEPERRSPPVKETP